MGQGLGHRQTLTLRALRALDTTRGVGGWHSPAAVLAALDEIEPPADGAALAHMDRADRMQLADVRRRYEAGDTILAHSILALEARIAERGRWAGHKAPNTVRRRARAGEDLNPSRVFASLEARGLVERRAHCGPGSVVRLRVPAG